MHYKEAKTILSATNGINVYRGCTHGCIYCDSRSECYQFDHEFSDVEIKTNAPLLLEAAIRKKRHPVMIGMGSMTDPYLPLESEIGNTHKCLEVIDKYNFGVTLITKSDNVLNDLDLLKSINKKAKCVVQMTLTTYDETLSKILEPNVCSTKRRAEVLNILRDNGIPTVVWMTPILPFINDTTENISGILDYCKEAKVYGIITFGMGMTLRKGNREYFYEALDKNFSGLKELYQKKFGFDYAIKSPHEEKLQKVFLARCKESNIVTNSNTIFQYLNQYPIKVEQLSMF